MTDLNDGHSVTPVRTEPFTAFVRPSSNSRRTDVMRPLSAMEKRLRIFKDHTKSMLLTCSTKVETACDFPGSNWVKLGHKRAQNGI